MCVQVVVCSIVVVIVCGFWYIMSWCVCEGHVVFDWLLVARFRRLCFSAPAVVAAFAARAQCVPLDCLCRVRIECVRIDCVHVGVVIACGCEGVWALWYLYNRLPVACQLLVDGRLSLAFQRRYVAGGLSRAFQSWSVAGTLADGIVLL